MPCWGCPQRVPLRSFINRPLACSWHRLSKKPFTNLMKKELFHSANSAGGWQSAAMAFYFIFSNKATQTFGKMWQNLPSNKKKSLRVNLVLPSKLFIQGRSMWEWSTGTGFSFQFSQSADIQHGLAVFGYSRFHFYQNFNLAGSYPTFEARERKKKCGLALKYERKSPCKLFSTFTIGALPSIVLCLFYAPIFIPKNKHPLAESYVKNLYGIWGSEVIRLKPTFSTKAIGNENKTRPTFCSSPTWRDLSGLALIFQH